MSIRSFLAPKPRNNPLTAIHLAPVLGRTASININVVSSLQNPPSQAESSKTVPKRTFSSPFLSSFWTCIEDLPSSLPEAVASNPIAAFAVNPASVDNSMLHGDDLWEECLNHFMKAMLGWDPVRGCSPDFIKTGDLGVLACFCFVLYFIEKCGVSKGLFEGKLSQMMDEMKKKG